jgi:hypothetical protein
MAVSTAAVFLAGLALSGVHVVRGAPRSGDDLPPPKSAGRQAFLEVV